MRNRGRIRARTLLSGVAVVIAISGCGGGKDFADKARPAVTVQLTGVITNDRVTVSPHKLGAGPVVITVSNQTQHSHTLTLDGPRLRSPVQVGPINPLDTGVIQKSLGPGHYTVRAGSSQATLRQIKPASLDIGKARPNSSGDTLLP